jgi:hypothetical protein
MNELYLIRIFSYSILPLLLATGHIIFDKEANTGQRRIELYVIYLLAISVGANGLSGAMGHIFYSDLVAEAIGWQAGSPFQLEMGFTNLALGILGIAAVSQRGGFRVATIIAVTVIGFGATGVHLMDIIAHGNMAPGNTIQNIGNLLDPILLIALTWYAPKIAEANLPRFMRWQARHGMIAGWAAAGVGIGFSVGHATNTLLTSVIMSALIGTMIGLVITRRRLNAEYNLATKQS